jgi:hypothetical protein
MVASAIGSSELAARAAATRGAQISRAFLSAAGGVSQSISDATLSLKRNASASPIIPPTDNPT